MIVAIFRFISFSFQTVARTGASMW